MKTNMNNITTIVEKTFPPRAVPHEVALDARSIVDQYTLHSENFDRAFTILKEFQKFLHELQEKTKRRKKIKEEYEHYSGKVCYLCSFFFATTDEYTVFSLTVFTLHCAHH